MKKRSLTVLLAVMLAAVLVVPAFAAETQAMLDYVTDEAGLLDADQRQALNAQAAAISEEMDCGVYILILSDYTEFADTIRDASKGVFTEYQLGYGDTQDGVMLTLSMADRDYWLLAHGDFGNAAFTDYGKEQLADSFLPDFGNNDWYAGFSVYLDQCETYLDLAHQGTPVDVEKYTFGDSLLAGFIPAIIVAFLICRGLKRKMLTARKQTDAAEYVGSGDVDIVRRKDRYTHTTVTRTKIERERSSSSSSGGGTSVDSDGFSGSGGKF